MDKIFLVFLAGLLVTVAQVTVGSNLSEDVAVLGELESLDIEEDIDIEFLDHPSWSASEDGSKVLVNVDGFGAVGDGVSDDTQAFVMAWKQACSTPKSVFLVPIGRRYLVSATRFKGPCAFELVVQIDGTIVAPDEPKNWDPKYQRNWLEFSNLNGVLFQGGGVIDGSGSKWWAASFKTANRCILRFPDPTLYACLIYAFQLLETVQTPMESI